MYVATTATKKVSALTKRLRICQGGTSASKTISILLYLITRAQSDIIPTLTSVVSESFPHLRRGAMRDFLSILKTHNYFKEERWNKSESRYEFETGSVIEFFSADQGDKLRGARRDRLFLNEANQIHFEAFEELEVRTKEFVFIDFNPTSEFWVFTEVIPHRTDVDYIILTYRDNEALSQEIISSIEQRKSRKGWFLVYGLGQLGEVEGKIYKGWEIIDEIPQEARYLRRGLDFGYSCLSGDTMITTSKGDKRMDMIMRGDYVLTRNGYKKVIARWSNGIKKVCEVDFGYGRRIVATEDHRIFTNNGWKRVDELNKKEVICEKRLDLTGKSTEDTQTENIQNTFSPQRTKVGSIGTFILSVMVKYLKAFTSITLTAIRLIMMLIILLPCLLLITLKSITTFLRLALRLFLKKEWTRFGQGLDLERTTTRKEESKACKPQESESKNVLSVIRELRMLGTLIKNTAGLSVIKERTQEKIKKNILVKNVERLLLHPLISKELHVLRSAHISCLPLKSKTEVFDLSVEEDHEFFANGVLVHNCDPTAVVGVYKWNDAFILDEELFRKGLSNKQIADVLLMDESNQLVVADSAEPKSIAEISQYGVNITGCAKGKDSVAHGIQLMQDQKIFVTKQSVNVIKAYRNYMWMVDKDGKVLNKPDHLFSDAMDAVRYAISSLIHRGENNFTDYAKEAKAFLNEGRPILDIGIKSTDYADYEQDAKRAMLDRY